MPAVADLPKPWLFNTSTARARALKSVEVKRLRKQQRLVAVEQARQDQANNAFALVARGKDTISRDSEAKSRVVHGLLGVEAVKQAESLAKSARVEPSTFKLVVEACDKLFGWSRQDQAGCLVQVGLLAQLEQNQPSTPQQLVVPEPIEVESA